MPDGVFPRTATLTQTQRSQTDPQPFATVRMYAKEEPDDGTRLEMWDLYSVSVAQGTNLWLLAGCSHAVGGVSMLRQRLDLEDPSGQQAANSTTAQRY